MSTYYLIANKTKKEMLSHGCIKNLGIHRYPYFTKEGIGRLLIYLLDANGGHDFRINAKNRFNPDNREHWNEGWFRGHWAGDELYFVNDCGCIMTSDDDRYYDDLYDAADTAYTDITFPAASDYNRYYIWEGEDGIDDGDTTQLFEVEENHVTRNNFHYRPYEEIVANEKYSEGIRYDRYNNNIFTPAFLRTPILFKKTDSVNTILGYDIKNENEKKDNS